MTSWQTRALCAYLTVTRKGRPATELTGERALADPRPPTPVPPALRPRTRTRTIGGFDVTTVVPRTAIPEGRRDPGAVLYLHGGAFIHGIASQHWRLAAEIADRTGKDVHLPFYGLAPRHDVGEARRFLRAVVTELTGAGPLHVAGDSAGGALALLLAQMHAGQSDVSGLTLIAPLLDLSLDNPEVASVEPTDPWLSRAGLMPALRSWAGERALHDPTASPLQGNLEGLPPTLVLVGSRDICLPDCRRLRRDASSSWDITLHVENGAPHVYPLLPTPEARAARSRLMHHIQHH